MNAQEAAKLVNSGMEKLSLSQLAEVYAVLKSDEKSAGLFRLVSGFARGQLSAYARSSADFQSKMTLEDAAALRELVEEVGFDEKDNLTENGKKVLEISARVAKRIKDQTVEDILKQKEPVKKTKPEPIALTPEQIKYLDEHGILHNGTLESIAWFKDRDEALKILAEAAAGKNSPSKPADTKKENDEDEVNKNHLAGIDISKNMQQLEILSSSIDPLDSKNKSFDDSRKSLEVLDVYDDEGHKYDVSSELVEQAKIRTEAELLDSKKVTKEEYVDRLKLNIDSAVYSIISGNAIDFSNYGGNKEHLQQVLKNKIDIYTSADAKKPSKAHVRLESVLGFMSVESARIDSKIEKIEKAVGSLPVIQKFKNKIKKFDEKCEQKFGPKTWGKARGAALVIEKAAPAIGMALVAGFGGPLGMGAYTFYVVKKHVVPFINKYMAQPKEQRTSFRKFCKENKKDAVLASLYTASAGLSAGMAVYGAISNLSVAAAEAASAGQTLDTVARAAVLTQHMGAAKMTLSGAAMLTRSAVSVYEAQKAGDKKERNRRLLIGLGSIAAFAGGIWARDALGNYLNAEKHNTETLTDSNSENAGTVNDTQTPPADDGKQAPNDTQTPPADDGKQAPDTGNAAPSVQYDDFYHGPEVEARSKESIIRLLTNSQVSRAEATQKAEAMIFYVKNMDGQVRLAFPEASDAQIAHAILLRAADVRKGDADELLRALLGSEECRKLTVEQQISEIHKGLTGYNYGQRSDLKFGYSLDPNYVPMNTRSLFLLDDCESERLVEHVGGRTITPPDNSTPPEEKKVEPEPEKKKVEPEPEKKKVEPEPEKKKAEPEPEKKKAEPQPEPQPLKSYKAGKLFDGKDTLAGGRDQINRLAELGVARYNDGKFRYVDYDEHYKMLRQRGFEDGRAQEIVKNRIETEQKELANIRAAKSKDRGN